MSLPLVTVMIPTYNQPETLEKAIESAWGQSYENMEIVVSDDASGDANVQRVLNRYAHIDSVNIIRNAQNIGRVANYHTTLYERANGEWVINLDGDDYFEDADFIQKAMSFAKANPSLIMISGRCVELMPDGSFVPHKENSGPARVLSPMNAYNAIYAGEYLPFHGSTLYRRDIAKGIGFYTSNTITSDFYSLLKLIRAGDVGSIDSIALVHRVHGANASIDMSITDWIDNAGVFLHRSWIPTA